MTETTRPERPGAENRGEESTGPEGTSAQPVRKTAAFDPAALDLIRGVVSADADARARSPAPEATDAAPAAAPVPAPAPAPARRDADRWADLRVDVDNAPEPAETAPAAAAAPEPREQDTPEPALAAPDASPLERIRAREAAGTPRPRPRPAREDAEAGYTPFDHAAFGATGTLDEAPRPGADTLMEDPEPAQPPRRDFVEKTGAPPPRDWGSVADHEMGRTAKMVWRVAVFGPIVALPAFLFLTSPFAPADTIKHYGALAGCGFANTFGVANAREGEPGYHLSLDKDADGVACEPVRSARARSGAGGARFIGN